MHPTSRRAAVPIAAALSLSVASGASAHAVCGDRAFPATLTIDDPGVNDELSLPTIEYLPIPAAAGNPSGHSVDYGFEWDKTITRDLGFAINDDYFTQRGAGGSRPPAHRLLWLAWTGLALTLIFGGVWLLAVATMMSGQPFAAAVAHGASEMVLLRTRFGEDWLVRLGLAAGVAICLALRGARGAARASAAGWAGLVLAGALLGALAWAGHGAATPGQVGRFHLAADILHLLAAGLWLGMLLPLASLLAEARRSGQSTAPDAAPWPPA